MKIAFVMFVLLSVSAEAVQITEIMYNPDGNEQDFEFIELFGNESVAGWHFEGIGFEFPNVSIQGYTVVAADTKEFFNRYGINTTFDFKGSLKNTGETIILRDAQGDIVDVVTYDDWAEENYSIERVSIKGYSSDPHNWVQSRSGGTPGEAYSEPNRTDAGTACSWQMFIDVNESISLRPEWKIKVLHEGAKANVTIVQQVLDAFGTIVEDYNLSFDDVARQRTSRTYSPRLNPGGNIIRAAMNNTCSNETMTASQLIYVPEKKTRNTSDIQIELVEEDYSFGEMIHAKMHIYRGDTRSYAINAFIRNEKKVVSEKTTLHVKTSFVNQTVVLPIQLKENCDEKYDAGSYDIVVEGFGITQTKKILITEGACKSKQLKLAQVTSSKAPLKNDTPARNQTLRNQTLEEIDNFHIDLEDLHHKRGVVIYESSSVRMATLVPWIISSALGLLAAGLVMRKN